MKLAFVNPPRIGRKRGAVEAEDCCWGLGPLVLPSMLLAAASEAQRMGHKVAFIDLAIDSPATIKEAAPDLVVHPLAWQWWEEVETAMQAACGLIQRIALAIPPGYMEHYRGGDAELILRGDTEGMVARLPVNGGQCWADLFSAQLGAYVAKGLIKGLDELSPIDYALVPSHYWPHYQAAVYQVSRGCPYRCTFCVWGGSTCTDPTFKMRPAKLVADNLLQLYGLSEFWRQKGSPIPLYLLCAQLTSDMEWIEEFHAEMTRENRPPYLFQSNINFADLTRDKLRLLTEAGLSSAGASLDGASDGILQLMRKPYTMEKALGGLLLMKDFKLLRRCRVRYGVGETQADVCDAVDWVFRIKEAGISKLHVNLAPIIHYEGTKIRETKAYGLIPLPGRGPERLVMDDPPDWQPYIDACQSVGWTVRVGPRK